MRNGDPYYRSQTARRVVARLTHTHGIWRLIPQRVKYWVNRLDASRGHSAIAELLVPFWYRLTLVVPNKGPLNVSYTRAKNRDRVPGVQKLYSKQTDEQTDMTKFITCPTNAVGRPN